MAFDAQDEAKPPKTSANPVLRNTLAGLLVFACLAVLLVATMSRSPAAILCCVLATALATLLLSPGKHLRQSRRLPLRGWAVLIAATTLAVVGVGVSGSHLQATVEAEFARSGQKRLMEAREAIRVGDGDTAKALLNPIASAAHAEIKPLSLAAEALVKAGANKGRAAEALVERGLGRTDEGVYLNAVDAIDPQLREPLRAAVIMKRQATEARRDEEVAAKVAQERVKGLLNGFDGSNLNVKRAVKATMHDPASFEHVESSGFATPGDNVTIYMTYRGTNGFGGVRTERVKALVTQNGEVLALEPIR